MGFVYPDKIFGQMLKEFLRGELVRSLFTKPLLLGGIKASLSLTNGKGFTTYTQ